MSVELFSERDGLMRELSTSISMMQKYGIEYAKAECNYKIELAKTALKLRKEDMAIGMINMTIYGTDDVPKLRFKRDTAEVMYKTAQENIQSVKLRLRLVEAQIEREWSEVKRSV